MIQKIVSADDPVLRKKSKPVKKIDKRILKLVQDLKDTLVAQKDPPGVGLAACQIGKNVRVFAMKDGDRVRGIINPQILRKSDNRQSTTDNRKILEGCLSIIDYYGPLNRPQKLTLKYLNEKGEKKTKIFKGFPAQIVQHEIDHLNGVLFTDLLLKAREPLYKYNKDKEWEEVDFGNL